MLILLLVGGIQQLKAQQFLPAKPDIKLTDSLNNYFKPKTYSPLQLLSVQPNLNAGNIGNKMVYDHMPIVKLQSTDNMPGIKLGGDGVKYTMLIKRIPYVAPADAAQVQPTP